MDGVPRAGHIYTLSRSFDPQKVLGRKLNSELIDRILTEWNTSGNDIKARAHSPFSPFDSLSPRFAVLRPDSEPLALEAAPSHRVDALESGMEAGKNQHGLIPMPQSSHLQLNRSKCVRAFLSEVPALVFSLKTTRACVCHFIGRSRKPVEGSCEDAPGTSRRGHPALTVDRGVPL